MSQDIHFSHIHASPLHLNPSLTGLYNADLRVIANVKQQWRSIGADYKTVGASIDGLLAPVGKHDFFSIGSQILADRAGSLNMGSSEANLSFAFVKALDRFGDQYLSFGLRGSLVNQSVDLTNVKVFDEDPLFPAFSQVNKTYADYSAGVSWFYNGSNHQLAYLGVAAFHLNQPDISFHTRPFSSSPFSELLFTRYVIHGGYESNAKNQIQALPSFIFMKQGPHQEITLGSFFKYNTQRSPGEQAFAPAFYWGAWLRWYGEFDGTAGIDALIMALRVEKNKMAYSLSYDLNISSLSRASRLQGGPEVSLIFMYKNPHKKKRRVKMKCPSF